MTDIANNPWRQDFPALYQKMHGKPLAFLDSAASSELPQAVINTLSQYYESNHANIHRGVYQLSAEATQLYEKARGKLQQFINAKKSEEVIFTSGATEAINLVANGFAESILQTGDEVVLTEMEHHSNIVPWQMACERTGAVLKIVPVTDKGELDMQAYADLLSERTKVVALIHVSNVLGTVNHVKDCIRLAHEKNIPVLLDGAQAVPHMPVDVQDLDCEFYAFSGHKLYGPTGVGVLYGKEAWLNKLPPYQTGGSMINVVTFDKTTFAPLPQKFEAGTPPIAAAIGLGAAVDYINTIGFTALVEHEQALLAYAMDQLKTIPSFRLLGPERPRVGVIAFELEGVHAHDVGTVLDAEGVAIRTGHHCTMPLHKRLGVPASARASIGLYNQQSDIDRLIKALQIVQQMFGS